MLALVIAVVSAILLPFAAQRIDPDLPVVDRLSGDRLPVVARLFEPINVRDTYLQKAAESLTDDQCGGATIVHRDIALCNMSLPSAYVIPHAAIRHNGEDCGTNRNDEYVLLVPGERLLTAEQATTNGLLAIYQVLNANARAKNALTVLNDLDPVYVGIELNRPRICGGVEVFPRYTFYFFINVSPGARDLNFRFAYLGTQELGLVTIKPDEQLCLLKESRNLGPGQSPFATPTPSPSPKTGEMALANTIFDLQNPEDLGACFPVHRLDPSGSPLPQPSRVSTPTPEVTATPTTNSTMTPNPTNATRSPSSTPTPTLGSLKSPTPSPSGEAADAAVCFPSDATVTLESGIKKRMANLRVGDKVLVAGGKYSDVFMFTHHTALIRSTFVRVGVSSGESLALSPSHYIPVSGQLKAARTVVLGDTVTLADGRSAKVVSVRRENLWGLHNPQTLDGTIVVDGVLASTFTETILPSAAVALLAPVKFIYSLGFRSGLLTNALAGGKPSWMNLLPRSSASW